MLRNLEQLERDVDAALQAFAGDIDRQARPGKAVIERVKCAARHEMNEQWLAAQETITPSAEVLSHVRQAVRDEVARMRDLKTGESRSRPTRAWMGGLAAAAMMALAVGIARYAGHGTIPQPTETSTVVLAAEDRVDAFLQAAESTFATDDFTSDVQGALTSIREKLSGSHDTAESTSDDLGGTVDEIMNGLDEADNTLGAIRSRAGVLG